MSTLDVLMFFFIVWGLSWRHRGPPALFASCVDLEDTVTFLLVGKKKINFLQTSYSHTPLLCYTDLYCSWM